MRELFALLNFLMPEIFGKLDDFMGWFDFAGTDADTIVSNEQEHSIVSNLHSILKPFLLRRIKTDVAKDLPRKIEIIVYCPLVDAQKSLYTSALKGSAGLRSDIITRGVKKEAVVLGKRKHADSKYGDISDDDYFANATATDIKDNNFAGVDWSRKIVTPDGLKAKGVGQMKLQNIAIQLRKVCCHPLLFDIPTNDDNDVDEIALGHVNVLPVYSNSEKGILVSSLPSIVSTSGKMLMLDRMLPALLASGHKVLIFSQMTKLLDIVSDYLDIKKWPFCRIDGSIKMSERQEQIQEGDVKIFLLSTRSGGLGINLTAADTVIIYDSDWNPQMDLQAQDRCHRIGQTKPVNSYRFITENSIEQHILSRASEKRLLERLVIHKNQFKGESLVKKIELEDLKELLSMENKRENSDHKVYRVMEDVLSDEELKVLLGRGATIDGVHKGFTVLSEAQDEKNNVLTGI